MLFVRGEIVVINSLKRTSCARWLLAVHSLVCVLTFVWVIVILFWPWLCSLLFSFLNKALLRSCSIELLHHLYPPHNISSIHLTTTTEMRRSGRIIDEMRSGWRTLRDSVGLFSSPTPEPTSQNDIPKTSCVRQSTSSPVSDVSAPAYTNRVWVFLRLVSVAQANGPLTTLPFIIHRPPDRVNGLTVVDDETLEWLLNTCPEI